MRIQETNQILKESRVIRNGAHPHEEKGMFARAWRFVTGIFHKK